MPDILIPNGGKTKLLTPEVRISLPQPIPNGGIVKVLRNGVVVGNATQLTTTTFVFVDTLVADRHYLYTARLEVAGNPSDSVDYKISAVGSEDILTTIYYTATVNWFRNGVSNNDAGTHFDNSGNQYTVLHEPDNSIYSDPTQAGVKNFFTPAYEDILKCSIILDQTVNDIPVFTQVFDPGLMNIPYITASLDIEPASVCNVFLNNGTTSLVSHPVGNRLNYQNVLGLDLGVIFDNLTSFGLTTEFVSRTLNNVQYIGCTLYLTRTPTGWNFIINDSDVKTIPYTTAQQILEPNGSKLTASFKVVSYPSIVRKETITTVGGIANSSTEMRGLTGSSFTSVNYVDGNWRESFKLSDMVLNDFVGLKTIRQGTIEYTPIVTQNSNSFNFVSSVSELTINSPFTLTGSLSGLRPNTDCEVVVFHKKKTPPQGNNLPWDPIPREFIGFKTDANGAGSIEVKVTETDSSVIRSEYYTKVRYSGGGAMQIAHSNPLQLSVAGAVPVLTFAPASTWQLAQGQYINIRAEETLSVGGNVEGMLAYADYVVKYFIKDPNSGVETPIYTVTKQSSVTGTFVLNTILTIPTNAFIGSNIAYVKIYNEAETVVHFTTPQIALTVLPEAVYSFGWATTSTIVAPGQDVEFTVNISGIAPDEGFYLRARHDGNIITPNAYQNTLRMSDGTGSITATIIARIPTTALDGDILAIDCLLQLYGSGELVHTSNSVNVTVDIAEANAAFSWALNDLTVTPGTPITGTASIATGELNKTYYFSGSVKNASSVDVITFTELYVYSGSTGTATESFSIPVPEATPIGDVTLHATVNIAGESEVLFTPTPIAFKFTPSIDFYITGDQVSTTQMRSANYNVAGNGSLYALETEYRVYYSFAGSDQIERNLGFSTHTSNEYGQLEFLSNLPIPEDAPLGLGSMFAEVRLGSSTVVIRSNALEINVIEYSPPPVITWAFVNGQETVVDENETVGFVGNISNLPPSSSFDVVFRREMNGARHDVSATISTNSSGVLTLDRTTTMARLGFYGGIYEGANMLYNVLVTNNNDITLTTPVISVVIGTVLPDPVITWTSTASNFVVTQGEALSATGSVINLVPSTEYTVRVFGQAPGYGEFTLFTENKTTDATGAFVTNFTGTVPAITDERTFDVIIRVCTVDTVNEVAPFKTLNYRVTQGVLASATFAVKPATPTSVNQTDNIYFISTVSDLVEDEEYAVTVNAIASNNQTYQLYSEYLIADANGEIVLDAQGMVDEYASTGAFKVYLTVQTSDTSRFMVKTPNLIYTIV